MQFKPDYLDEGFLHNATPSISFTFNGKPRVEIHSDGGSSTKIVDNFEVRKQYLITWNIISSSGEIHWIYSDAIMVPPEQSMNYRYTYAEFFCDWYVELKEFHPEYGFHVIKSHRYNDRGRPVLVKLHTEDDIEADIWAKVAIEYQKLHDCNLSIMTKSDMVLNKYQDGVIPYVITNPWEEYPYNIYSTYDIGRFSFVEYGSDISRNKTHYDLFDKENLPDNIGNRYPTTNLFASFKNPRNYNNQSSEDIARDILGLSDWKII
jgi:hypothetical protein